MLAERRAAARDRRHLALLALIDELHKDRAILDDPTFAPAGASRATPRVYPRLPVSATDAALVSAALIERSDADLLRRLHEWRDEANGFNRRLELTELRIFATNQPGEVGAFERALHRDDGYLNQVRDHLDALTTYVSTSYLRLDPERNRSACRSACRSGRRSGLRSRRRQADR